MKLLNLTDYEQINMKRFNELKELAINTNKHYYQKRAEAYVSFSNTFTYVNRFTSNNPHQEKVTNKTRNMYQSNFYPLSDLISDIINTNKYKFLNELEQIIFKVNTYFPNDENFLKYLKNSKNSECIDTFVRKYFSYDSNDEEQNRSKQQSFTILFFKNNEEQLIKISKYFKTKI